MTYTNRAVLALGLGLMLQSTAAFAQGRGPWYNDDDYYRNNRRGGYGANSGYGYGSPVARVMSDLDNVGRRAYNGIDSHERNHISRAMSELRKFDDRARSGKFDRGALDKAIDHLNDLANARQLHPQDRSVIARDRDMLRDFRSRAAYNGGYNNGGYNNGPYRNDPYYRGNGGYYPYGR